MSDSEVGHVPMLSDEEVLRRGEEWFEQRIKSFVENRPPMECVSIDVLTGEFATAAEPLDAAAQLRAKQPDAVIWTRRVGFPYVHRFGFVPKNRPVKLRRVS